MSGETAKADVCLGCRSCRCRAARPRVRRLAALRAALSTSWLLIPWQGEPPQNSWCKLGHHSLCTMRAYTVLVLTTNRSNIAYTVCMVYGVWPLQVTQYDTQHLGSCQQTPLSWHVCACTLVVVMSCSSTVSSRTPSWVQPSVYWQYWRFKANLVGTWPTVSWNACKWMNYYYYYCCYELGWYTVCTVYAQYCR